MYYTGRNEITDIYFKEIRGNESLTKDEELRLFALIREGDESARGEVFNRMAKLAVAVAKTFTGDADLLNDLIQEANIGILEAIDKFDPALGNRFSGYAQFWMRAMIMKFLGDKDAVNAPETNLADTIDRIKSDYYRRTGDEMTEYDLLDELDRKGINIDDLSRGIRIKVKSIDKALDDDDDDFTVEDSSEYNNRTACNNDYEKVIEEDSLKDDIRRMMTILDDREKTLVSMRFGIGYDFEMTNEMISDEWNKSNDKKLTSERVRQIIEGALYKMRQSL